MVVVNKNMGSNPATDCKICAYVIMFSWCGKVNAFSGVVCYKQLTIMLTISPYVPLAKKWIGCNILHPIISSWDWNEITLIKQKYIESQIMCGFVVVCRHLFGSVFLASLCGLSFSCYPLSFCIHHWFSFISHLWRLWSCHIS